MTPTNPPGPSVSADLLADFATDVALEIKRLEDGIFALHQLVESMRREAARAKDGVP